MATRHTGPSRSKALAELGLSEGASTAEITRRFRRLAKQVHPDTSAAAPDSAQRLTAICDAYHLLTRAGRRRPPPAPALGHGAGADGRGAWVVAGPVRVRPFHVPGAETWEPDW